MPPRYLPAELLDHIVDHLHDTRDALKSCCLVSTSWVSRTRKHLFAKVTFKTAEHLQSWKTTFPDPSTSPAHYTEDLVICCPESVTAADAEERGWVPTFSEVEYLNLDFDTPEISLLPFHRFSPAIKSLRINFAFFPYRRVLNLIHSFSFLEDLSLFAWGGDQIEDVYGQPAFVQPPLTGSLNLYAQEGMNHIVSQLFPPQNGLYFRKLDLGLIRKEDIFATSALVEGWYFTFESLEAYAVHRSMTVRPLRSHQWLIPQQSIVRPRGITKFERPLESDRTQRRGAQVEVKSSLGGDVTPNDHSKPPKSPTNLAQDTLETVCQR